MSENDLDFKHEVITGFYADSLKNRNIKFYWNEDTYFSNTQRSVQEVYMLIGKDSIRLEQNLIYDLSDYFNGTLTSVVISVKFDDGTVENKTNKVFFTNVQQKNDCAEQFGFTGNNRPWSSLGGMCKWGIDTLHLDPSSGFADLEMTFSVLWGCGDAQVLDKPFIMVAGWGPYTDKWYINEFQGFPASLQELYWSYNQEGYIDNLVGAGYDVIIAKFNPPNQSILKNSILLERLIKMVNEEKYANGSYEENIISGYSAGALCARLTLQRMEKEHLEGTNDHHHTKLFVSIEGENGGANIPLGLQHGVEYLEQYYGYSLNLKIYGLHYILNAPLSRELLRYFYTETGSTSLPGQGPHPQRTAYLQYHDWFNHPKNTHNPGYPAFNRNISISNGMSQSDINGAQSNHFPYPNTEGSTFFDKEECVLALSPERVKCSFMTTGTKNVFKNEYLNIFNNWNIISEKWTKDPLIMDNAPGGSGILSVPGASFDEEPNFMYQVLSVLDNKVDCPTGTVNYEDLYCFTPTLLTHDIRNFDPSTTGGRLDYDMKAEGLMYQNISDFQNDPSNPNYSSYWGYPHLAHPQDHYTNYTPFDAVFAWDERNTVHARNTNPVLQDNYYLNGAGRWFQQHSTIQGVIKNFIVAETDFYNAFIQNRKYGWNARSDYTYRADIVARNEIYIGESVTQRTDFKPAEIFENASVNFTACKEINIKPGFHTQAGSEFHAKVDDEVCDCGGSKSALNTGSPGGDSDYSITGKPHEVLYSEEKSVNSMDIRLYPNPGRDKVKLEINDEKVFGFEYSVFDLQGKQIMANEVNGTFTTLVLDEGVYIVKIKTNHQWHTKKLIMY